MAVTEISARANAAVDDLYRRHVGDIYRYSYAVLGNHADAEDVTQTTFVNALRALERGETPRDASRWLIVIAHNVVRQRWRQAAARPALVELDGEVADGTLDVEEDVELEELVRALQRIPETQREALVMRELEGRSYREIAEVLAISSAALETLLFRARRSLAEELENVVTCQNAEQVMSKQLDGRVSRKERKRLEAHLAECPSCTRLAAAQKRQRRAFKGLALLPLPLGLALFKGAPTASAATALPTIGLGTNGAAGAGAGAGAAAASGTGGTAVGGSFLGAAAAKVAVAAVAATMATGVGYKAVQGLRDEPAPPPVVVAAAPDAGARTGGALQAKPSVRLEPVVAKQAVAGATAGAASGAKSAARVKSVVAATGGAATYVAPVPTSGADGTSAAKPKSAAAPVVPKPTETPSASEPEKPKQAAPPAKAAPAPPQKSAPPTQPATPPAAPAAAVPAPSPATPPAATQPLPVTPPAPPVAAPTPLVTPPVPTPTDSAPTDPAPPSGEDSGADDQPGNGNGWGHHKGNHDGKHPWDG